MDWVEGLALAIAGGGAVALELARRWWRRRRARADAAARSQRQLRAIAIAAQGVRPARANGTRTAIADTVGPTPRVSDRRAWRR